MSSGSPVLRRQPSAPPPPTLLAEVVASRDLVDAAVPVRAVFLDSDGTTTVQV
eukprot:SAG31_NODE_43912_length_265_cov_0.620482_1_plen_52_part_01